MNIALWIVAAVLALAFAAFGLMKLTQPRAKLAESGLAWAGDFSDGAVKGIGAGEFLGAVGLILPAAVNTATVLVPVAACGLVALMIGDAAAGIGCGNLATEPDRRLHAGNARAAVAQTARSVHALVIQHINVAVAALARE